MHFEIRISLLFLLKELVNFLLYYILTKNLHRAAAQVGISVRSDWPHYQPSKPHSNDQIQSFSSTEKVTRNFSFKGVCLSCHIQRRRNGTDTPTELNILNFMHTTSMFLSLVLFKTVKETCVVTVSVENERYELYEHIFLLMG